MNGEQQSTAPYRLNINHPEIREAYEAYKLRRGIPSHDPSSDQERDAFEREWMAAYLAARRREAEPGVRRICAVGPVTLNARYGDNGQALYLVEDKRPGREAREIFHHPLEAWGNFIGRVDCWGRARLGRQGPEQEEE